MFQRRIQNPLEHLGRCLCDRVNEIQPYITFAKIPTSDVWQGSQYISLFETEKCLCSRKRRSKLFRKILILLCTSLMLLLIVFLTGIEKSSSTISCQTVAALLHYFILTTFLWMGAKAVNLYQMFVQIYQSQTRSHKRFLIQASIIAWGK